MFDSIGVFSVVGVWLGKEGGAGGVLGLVVSRNEPKPRCCFIGIIDRERHALMS